MKQLQLELPDQIAGQIEALVRNGWFHDEQELIRVAILDFLQRRRLELAEEFQREDINWALRYRKDHR